MIVEGQVHGGLAQGIGQALLEGAVYDDSGQLVTASFMDYTMPRADDLPSFKLSHTTTLCPGNPLGVKGCGEAGAIGSSAAVINAITDAIGNNKLEMPATPDRVWHAIHGCRGRATMYETTYHRPSTVDEAAALFAKGSDVEISRRRPHPDPGDEAAAGRAVRRDRSRQDQGTGRHRGVRRRADHQGGDHLFRHHCKAPMPRRRSPRSCI